MDIKTFKKNLLTKKILLKKYETNDKIIFNTVEELEDLLKNNTKSFINATIIENINGNEEEQFSFYTENFYFDYKFVEQDDELFGYYCDNNYKFYQIIFRYLSNFKFVNLFYISNCEDDEAELLKENFSYLGKDIENIYISLRSYFFRLDINNIIPNHFIDKLYFSSDCVQFLKWRPEYYSDDEDYKDSVEECLMDLGLI